MKIIFVLLLVTSVLCQTPEFIEFTKGFYNVTIEDVKQFLTSFKQGINGKFSNIK